jgi:hypothetical protein
MRDGRGRTPNQADLAIKSAGAAREHVRQHNLPVVVEITGEEDRVQYVVYTCTDLGEVAQLKVRVDHNAGTAFPVYDTGYHDLLERVKRGRAVSARAA